MKTFISWVIANFEIILTVVICIVFGILFAKGIDPGTFSTEEKWGIIAIAVFCMAMPASMTVKNFSMSAIMFALMLAEYIYVILHIGDISDSIILSAARTLLAVGAVSFVLSVTVGIYTAINMDDVVSLRMLYVNSDVDMFDMTLKYSLNRFMAAFVYISWAGLWTVGYYCLKSLSV